MLLSGKIEYHLEPKDTYMLPFHTPQVIDEQPSPRVINSHMYFRHLPQDILTKRNKIIFVNRNPKDIAVSYYDHCQKVALKYKGSWEDFLELFMADDGRSLLILSRSSEVLLISTSKSSKRFVFIK